MPLRPSTVPRHEPEDQQAVAGVRFVQRRGGERGTQEVDDHVVHAGDLHEPGADGADRQHGHRHAHRQRALGDRVVGAGEADVGVLHFAVGRIGGHLGVVQVAAFQLARLGDGVAVEGAEDHPERVDRGQEGAEVAHHVQHPVPPAALGGDEQDLVLGEEPGEGGDARQREAADHEAGERERQRLAEAAHLLERLLPAHRADDRAGAHEQQRLEECVGHQVKQPRGVGADGDAHDHVADLGHRGVGDHALDVGLHERDRARDQEGEGADHRAGVLRGGGEFEERVHARDQVHARRHHRRGVDQRGDGRGTLHRVGQPRVQGDLRGLGGGADEQQQTAGGDVRFAGVEHVGSRLEDGEEFERAGVLEDEVRPEHEPHVADDVDHERLDPGARGGGAAVPEGDQQVRGGADERPPDDQQQEVAGEHQQQHREDEEVEVREVAREAAVLLQVGDRVEVDHRRDPGDDEDHVDRERVHEDRDVRVDAHGHRVVPQRGGQLAVGGRVALHLDQRPQRGHEREADRRRGDPPGRAAWQGAEAEADHERPEQREQQHEPAPRCRAHPCNSRSSSTSIGSRRR